MKFTSKQLNIEPTNKMSMLSSRSIYNVQSKYFRFDVAFKALFRIIVTWVNVFKSNKHLGKWNNLNY